MTRKADHSQALARPGGTDVAASNATPVQGELLPAFDATQLPSLEQTGQFISQHTDVADYAIRSVDSKHSRRT